MNDIIDNSYMKGIAMVYNKDKDYSSIGESCIDLIPAHTTIILRKTWDASFIEVTSYTPYVDKNDVYTINYPSGFDLHRLEVVGVGKEASIRLPLELGMIIELREPTNHQVKRIYLDSNDNHLTKIATDAIEEFKRIKKEIGDAQAFVASKDWRYKVIEYLITDIFNVAYIYR